MPIFDRMLSLIYFFPVQCHKKGSKSFKEGRAINVVYPQKYSCPIPLLYPFPCKQMSKPPAKTRSRKFNEEGISDFQADLKKGQPYRGILGSGKTSDRIKLTMWNVNGIRSVLNKNALNNFVNMCNPDFICINQTKINQELFEKSPIELKGYHGYWNFCKVSAGYSGVAIFSKFLPISIFQDLEEAAYSQEGRVITLEFEHFYLVTVYIPSAGDKKLERLFYKTQQYQKAFHRYCESLKKKGKGVIVCGDLNVCHEEIDIHFTPFAYKHPGFTPEQRKSIKNFLGMGWVDTFRKLNPTLKKYTWWRIEHGNRERNIGKRLDYFLVNEAFFPVVEKSQVLSDVKGSDHCPIYLVIDLKRIKQGKKEEVAQEKVIEETGKTETQSAVNQQEKIEDIPPKIEEKVEQSQAEQARIQQATEQKKEVACEQQKKGELDSSDQQQRLPV